MLEFLKIFKNTLYILSSKEKRNWTFLLGMGILVSIADIASLIVLVFVIGFYSHIPFNSAFYLPGYVFQENPILLLAFFMGFILLKNWLAQLVVRFQFQFVYNVAGRIADDNLKAFLNGRFADYISTDSSVFIRKISYQPIEFGQYVLSGIQQIFTEVILILITLSVLVFYQSGIIVILFLALLPPVLFVSIYIRRKLRVVRNNIADASEKSLQFLQESLNGYVEANVYDKKHFFENRFTTEQSRLNQYLSTLQATQNSSQRLLEVLAVLGLLILFLLNAYLLKANESLILNIGTFLAASYKIIPGAIRILNLKGQLTAYAHTLQNLSFQPNSFVSDTKLDKQEVDSFFFNKVSFQYQNRIVLKNISFEIKRGDFVNLVGNSGKGKTTLINLLLGFIEENSGQIGFNSKPVKANERLSFWKNIAYVKQQNFLINDSIKRNITFDETKFDNEAFEEALNATGLYQILGQFEKGSEHIISENGKNISGGQRQRIAIARAIYKKADIYLLDEPFSELDENSENEMLEYFRKLAEKGKMVILISHNKQTLTFCNKMVSLDES